MAKKDRPSEVKRLYHLAQCWERQQWELVNQKGYEFAHDEQLSQNEKDSLEAQGMPTFIINRILPVVEMLNFYATANNPRWQAIGVEGSDSDVAAVFSDLADYVWNNSDGNVLYANAVNDAITKGIGYLLVSVDKDADNGMGEVTITQPEPFDVFVDPKSRDILFRDAAFIMIRKVLPAEHLKKLFPDKARTIANASSDQQSQNSYTERSMGDKEQKLFSFNDPINVSQGITAKGEDDQLVEFFEVYEKVKIEYSNVYYRIPPDPEVMKQIQQQCEVQVKEMAIELEVQLKEQAVQMEQAVQSGEMLPERFELEMQKAQEMMVQQIESYRQECMSMLQNEASKVENMIVTKKEFNVLIKDETFAENVLDAISFFKSRIKQTCVVGDKLLYEYILPDSIEDYPIIPFHFKWTGTPFPMSAVSPLIGKQQEINKAHQIMVHNASLGSSLRWMYEEGSIDTELWERYSSAPGALLPIRPGITPPTPVQPAPLSNAFFTITQEGKQDMEYLAGIYSSMMGDAGGASETYRGMLALDEYGTRRIKQWMKNSIEPALRDVGRLVMQFSQGTYTAYKRFRIVQPNAIQEHKQQEVNIPIYNDMGEAIGKSMDIASIKFDVRIISGSTMPINRWAYLEELKQLMQMGVIDDIALLAETDIKNKEKIVERKSLYSQLQGQIEQLSEAMKDKDGTIETLERQLVQAGIKGKVMQAEMEITKKKEQAKGQIDKEVTKTASNEEIRRKEVSNEGQLVQARMGDMASNFQKDLDRVDESE